MGLKLFEHYSSRVPIQPRVVQGSHERNMSTEHEFQSPNNACTDLLRWTDEMKEIEHQLDSLSKLVMHTSRQSQGVMLRITYSPNY